MKPRHWCIAGIVIVALVLGNGGAVGTLWLMIGIVLGAAFSDSKQETTNGV